ncbi:MAG TPA: SDR family NAD(P)-dependent oxidoreductase [Thermoanaerobaculia bacterium]|nr:SDR family NAD(P)-dependent oxidoreductase [Thermoanaerobaculia bacterium]HUM29360.1 SDR family NAD(P)-dependent oxidoreductase [Thermoanaerobaculia bacterium]HXK67606.1 SDR family NAD(P)-dependent oxidoreductase [Thermoanaerobaculia bacterium]
MLNVKGKTALITGGSLGIGKATVEIFAREGITPWFTYYRHQESAEALSRDIGAPCIRADLRDRSGWDQVLRALSEADVVPDIVVHNAGIWNDGTMGAMAWETWREMMSLNLDAVGYLTNALVPGMKARGSGVIIFVSSTAARRGEAYHGHYAATKGALISLAKSLAAELGPHGIRTNVVAPGWVDTPMSEGTLRDPERREAITSTIPLRRIPIAEDIAYPILFLVSDWARHINGATLDVNGGAVLIGG